MTMLKNTYKLAKLINVVSLSVRKKLFITLLFQDFKRRSQLILLTCRYKKKEAIVI
jgi:hypothetical protein